jgi:acetyl-CoA carboxylase biotin carboxylase subunit
LDSALYHGYEILPFYDSMLAKLIVLGRSREEALARICRALSELVVEGIDTNIDFLFQILYNDNYIEGRFDTSFIAKEFNLM